MGTKTPTTEKKTKAKDEVEAAPKPAKSPKGHSNLQNVPVEKIKVKKGFNPRGAELGELGALIKSVKANGITQPITLCPTSEGADTYYVVAGHRRFQAAVDLGKESVPANIVPYDINSAKAFIIAASENVGSDGDDAGIRKDLTPLQYAAAGNKLRELFTAENEANANVEGYKVKKTDDASIASELGIAYQRLRRYMQLHEIPPALRARVEDGTVSARAAVTILEVPEDLRNAVAKRVVAGVDAAEVLRIANEVKNKDAKVKGDEEAEEGGKKEKPKKPKNLVTEKDVRKIAAEEKVKAKAEAAEEGAEVTEVKGRRLCLRPFGQRLEYANASTRRPMDEVRAAMRNAAVAVLNAREAKENAKKADDATAAGKAQLAISVNKAILSALSWVVGESIEEPTSKGEDIDALVEFCRTQLDDEQAMAKENEAKPEKEEKAEKADASETSDGDEEPKVVKKKAKKVVEE